MTRDELVEMTARALANEPGDVARNMARAVLAVVVPEISRAGLSCARHRQSANA